MRSLREALQQAESGRTAIGHFNVSDTATLNAVAAAARELDVPVLLGASEGEREFLGTRRAAAIITSMREEEGRPVFLNADHTHSLAKAEEAARAGFDLILFDASGLALEQNAAQTRNAVEAIKSVDPTILVEGEVGYIGAASEIHDQAPRGLSRHTTPEEARQFIAATGVDILAPAVGNMHGMLRSMVAGRAEKRLDLAAIRAIKGATGSWLTLHGASGTNDGDLRAAIGAGINIIHINTELRLAWRRGLEAALAAQPDEIAPYKLLPQSVEAVKQVVLARLRLFTGRDKAAA